MATYRDPLSGERVNRMVDSLAHRAIELHDHLVRMYLASGYPPGTTVVSEREEYQNLAEMLQTDPKVRASKAAQRRFEELSRKLGPQGVQ